MHVKLAYYKRSGLTNGRGARTLSLAPNLARDPVALDAPLKHPLRFREAISALHDVVINDLRFKPRDKTAYEEWKKAENQRLAVLRRETYKKAKQEILAKRGDVPAELEKDYRRCLRQYWSARQQYASYLLKHDYELWRKLMPCDPVVTVGDEVVFFECFSADESSYGCLTVDRQDGFGAADNVQFGTTNVDYSWELYNHFQQLRSYRQTRFRVDPEGFEVATEGSEDYREEKIDLPQGWLRGFMQIQSAMGFPMRKVSLSPETVYSLLAWLKRNKAKQSPRAMRFELLPGEFPKLTLEPWEKTLVSYGDLYDGPGGEPIRIWGRRRLLVLSRLLPLLERVDVYLLGAGLPSFWVAQMGEMRLTLGLSGWTTNDWTRGSALDLLAPPGEPNAAVTSRLATIIRERQAISFEQAQTQALAGPPECAAALNHLAHTGQVIFDLSSRRYRWRQIMPQALGEAEMGPDNPELAASRSIAARKRWRIESQEQTPSGLQLVTAQVDNKPVEMLLDNDGMIKRGKCLCSHHYRYGIRMGPCRHLLALRTVVLQSDQQQEPNLQNWYQRLSRWANN